MPSQADIEERLRRFGVLLTDAQPQLYAFAITLVADLDLASDIVQEANAELWENAPRYDPDRDFVAWACGVVRYRVLSHYRDSRRDKLHFGSELPELIASEESMDFGWYQRRQAAFNACFKELTDHQRMLIEMRYDPTGSVSKMAGKLGRPAASISVTLSKIRTKLTECTQRKLAAEETI